MGTPPLSPGTEERIDLMFTPEHKEMAGTMLLDECGHNLPLYDPANEQEVERIRFAVLKLSKGKVDKLQRAVGWAKTDWRDVLLWAGFATNATAHKSWMPRSYSEATLISRLLRWWAADKR